MEKQKEANKISQALQATVMNGVKLGFEIGKLQGDYCFNTIVEFIKGNITNCYAFDIMKPLYDNYGYETTNKAIIYIAQQFNINSEETKENTHE